MKYLNHHLLFPKVCTSMKLKPETEPRITPRHSNMSTGIPSSILTTGSHFKQSVVKEFLSLGQGTLGCVALGSLPPPELQFFSNIKW